MIRIESFYLYFLLYLQELALHASTQMPQLPNYVAEYDAKPKTKILGVTL